MMLEAYALATAGLAIAVSGTEVGILAYSRSLAGADDPPAGAEPGEYPSLSVIIPAYREGRTVLAALESAAGLDYPRDKLEVVLALERGDRATAAALEGVGVRAEEGVESTYKGVKVKVAFNRGARSKPAALNSALGAAGGDIIGVCDAEDVLEARAAKEAARILSSSGAAAVQFARNTRNPGEAGPLTMAQHVELEANSSYFIPAVERLTGFVPLLGSGYFIWRGALEAVGGWNPSAPAEDLELSLRLYGRGYRVAFAREALVHTLAVTSLRGLIRQRERWVRGTLLLMPRAARLAAKAWPILMTYMLSPVAWLLAEAWPVIWVLRPSLLPFLLASAAVSLSLYAAKLRLQGKGAGFVPLVSLAYAAATWVALAKLLVSPHSWTKTR